MDIRCKDGVIEYIYQDGVKLAGLDNIQIRRASSIEPMPTGVRFKIVWAEHVAPYIGEAETLQDDDGKPFTTRAAALLYETARLRKDYLGVSQGC